jgi:predicted nucleic acid-binding protein
MIADTSAIYALIDADDVHHQQAKAFIQKEGENLLLVVTETTLFEVITLVKSRLGQKIAVQVLHAICSSRFYRLVHLSDEDRKETWRIFEKYADKDWSLFDCACLAVARNHEIGEAFAFDRHFQQMAAAGLLSLP